ncbi:MULTISPECIES: HipA family kinase [Bradyrhizobium]|uniref:HipA family kinase n=1 Tax=Bradyrhizobium TaxID=374 RepID=UPI000231CB1B|nr:MULTISPECIES: HipA family kinase [Bradyrhizobium]AJA62531.1 hypothetical protein RN69_20990 [Bradyrhizobium japonicum]KMJ98319.1 hypothetical protein CF64_14090 [Bradyrhizobium japonicum]MCK1445553.1 hypothetical protein [Bradyrhizobium sp. 48]MCK1460637.1 hypothetical protein [Bradyrhizobium sp. 2]MCS3540980.1 hypothetical protein [Bradyrhizobium japonicum]
MTHSQPMSIRFGVLLLGAVPVGTGLKGAVRGFADVQGTDVAVVAKKLPDEEILGEIYCSLLCRAVGLPAPEPLLLKDQATGAWMFGSVDLPHPNCSQFLNFDAGSPQSQSMLGELLRNWPALPKVAAFDEWINNRDRNLQNILWQDENTFALIDHGKALNLDPHYADRNVMIECWLAFVANSDQVAQQRLKRDALRFADLFDDVQARDCAAELVGVAGPDLPQAFAAFVCDRLVNIVNHIGIRFPNTQLRMQL